MTYIQEPLALERQLEKGRVERGVEEGKVRLEDGENRLRDRMAGEHPVEAPQLDQIRRAADRDALRQRVHQQQQIRLDGGEGDCLGILQTLQRKSNVAKDPRLERRWRNHNRVAALEQLMELEHLEQTDLVVHVFVHERLDCLGGLGGAAVDVARDRVQLLQHVVTGVIV